MDRKVPWSVQGIRIGNAESFSIWQLYRSQAMETFRRLVAYFNTFIEDGFGKFDVIEKLPIEISNMIFQ